MGQLLNEWHDWYARKAEDVKRLLESVPELEGSSLQRVERLWELYSHRVSATWLHMDASSITHFREWFLAVRKFFSDNSEESSGTVSF